MARPLLPFGKNNNGPKAFYILKAFSEGALAGSCLVKS